jgi:hypothetical protein
MTREQLLEGIENAILEASDGYMSNPKIAQAVLDYISPMLGEVREALQYYSLSHKVVGNLGTGVIESVFNGEKAQKALAQLECFVVKGGM